MDTGTLPGCEFGHIVIQKDGLPCSCGKLGCWEKYASMKAFKNNIRKVLGVDEKIRGKDLLNILKNIKESDVKFKGIEKVVSEYIEYLAIGISNLVNIFEPEVIGIGGSFVYFEDILLQRLKKEFKCKNMLFNSRENINIEIAILQNDAGIIGAII